MKFLKKEIKLEAKAIRSLMDGTLLYKGMIKKNLAYIIFCSLLLVFYIGNRYKSEGQLAEIAKLEKEITNLRYESITTSAELMSLSRQSEVLRLVKSRGLDLNESVKAPQRIYIDNE